MQFRASAILAPSVKLILEAFAIDSILFIMGYLRVILGLYWGYIGVMENKMEAIVVYWGYRGIMENRMETTIGELYWVYIV